MILVRRTGISIPKQQSYSPLARGIRRGERSREVPAAGSTLPDEPNNAPEVGRVEVRWNNFWPTTRTFEVEMEVTEVLIEYTSWNLMQSNWNELLDRDFHDWIMADYDEKGNKYDEEGIFTFLLFGSWEMPRSIWQVALWASALAVSASMRAIRQRPKTSTKESRDGARLISEWMS